MQLNVRRGITVVFLSASTVFMIIVGYTTHLYFAVYVTMHSFNVSIPKLDIDVIDNSQVLIKTPIIIQNPSECTLQVNQIIVGFRLQNEFILTKSYGHHIQLLPGSTVNITIEAEVPAHKVQYVIMRLGENWLVNMRIFLLAPIAGTVSWQNAWYITEVTITNRTS